MAYLKGVSDLKIRKSEADWEVRCGGRSIGKCKFTGKVIAHTLGK